jgi:hypothetical protein
MRALIVTSLASIALTGPASAAMTPKEIKDTFFNGQAFVASTPQKIRYKMVFMPDGKMTREPLGKAGVAGEGTWKLTGDGFCTTWKGAKQNCYRLVAGDNKWSVMTGTTAQAFWTRN